MEENILKQEKSHLSKVLNLVKEARVNLQKSLDQLGKETVDKLKDLRANPETNAMDFFFYLEQLHEKNAAFNLKDRYARIEEMDSSQKEPYFARIDLANTSHDNDDEAVTPKNEKSLVYKEIYIGKFGFTHNREPIITDWRSKIASVYYRYRYPQKNVTYRTPEGEKTKDLLLKRTFDITDGSLTKYYNNDIQLDESEIIAKKIETRTGGVLEDIVETIQEAQLDIIEESPQIPCVVQGCVGSGKSTVAIHKLSHIFFNFPKLIHPSHAILIAKHQILISYLATLFPKLGIFDINYKTLADLVYNFIFREELPIKPDFSLPQNTDLLKMETLTESLKIVGEIEQEYEVKLEQAFMGDYETFGGYKYDRELTPYENVKYVIEELSEELATQKERLKTNPKSQRAWLYKMNSESLSKLMTDLNKIKNDLKDVSLKKALKKLNIKTTEKMDYATTLIYVLLYSRIIGFSKKKTIKYQYCVVDEGQDLSPIEYAVLDPFVIHKRFCILGDLNQGFTGTGLSSWDELNKVFGVDKIKKFELDTNYRSTKPIIDLAKKILCPYTNKYLPKSINRKGAEPTTKIFDSKEAMLKDLEKVLAGNTANFQKSVGIIVYNSDDFARLKEIVERLPVEDSRKIVLESDKRIDYKPQGIYLTKFENCKGLEFADVYLVGRNPLENSSVEEARKSFVGVTRAMDNLNIYYTAK